ncbi:hypothetical protein ZWY2020_057597 [Hordeum vulgare]|nr:hypothetical protein ZWY2020_057597 [Hordeum vulgare]
MSVSCQRMMGDPSYRVPMCRWHEYGGTCNAGVTTKIASMIRTTSHLIHRKHSFMDSRLRVIPLKAAQDNKECTGAGEDPHLAGQGPGEGCWGEAKRRNSGASWATAICCWAATQTGQPGERRAATRGGQRSGERQPLEPSRSDRDRGLVWRRQARARRAAHRAWRRCEPA